MEPSGKPNDAPPHAPGSLDLGPWPELKFYESYSFQHQRISFTRFRNSHIDSADIWKLLARAEHGARTSHPVLS